VDFLRRQVLTSRNVTGTRLTTLAMGGLNYQIEHHLFPSMPRSHLRNAQRLLQAYCAQHQIPYTETGLFASYACALRYLHTLGEALRASQLTRSKAGLIKLGPARPATRLLTAISRSMSKE